MDLGTICAKLRASEYETVSTWQDDVNQVWENCYAYNGRQSMVSLLARQLQTTFKELTEFITPDEKNDWLNKLADLHGRVSAIRSQSPKLLQPQKVPKAKDGPAKQKIVRTQTQKEKKSIALPKPAVPTRNSSVRPAVKQFTHEEIMKLTDDVNQLEEDEKAMGRITDLICKYEPQLIVGEEVELELSTLKSETLVALRELVDKLYFL
jgi:bromodomain-containing factor 1